MLLRAADNRPGPHSRIQASSDKKSLFETALHAAGNSVRRQKGFILLFRIINEIYRYTAGFETILHRVNRIYCL
jgi:hypothetical protein